MRVDQVNLNQYDRRLQSQRHKAVRSIGRSMISLVPAPHYRHLIPEKRFVIFGQGRTGSTLLVSLLDSQPNIHCDGEILHHWKWFPERHILSRMAGCRKQVYGFKLLSYQLDNVLCLSQPYRFIEWLLQEEFRIIYLERRNLLRHAISQISARINRFHKRDQTIAHDKKINLESEELFWWIETLQRRQQYEASVLRNFDFLHLIYEEDLMQEKNWENTASRVCKSLNLPTVPPTTNLLKVTPEKITDLVANYDELVKMLHGTSYQVFLDEQ